MPKKYRDVRRLLQRRGWTKIRQKGSHETWRSPDGQRQVVVAGKDSANVSTGTLGSLRRATGIEELR